MAGISGDIRRRHSSVSQRAADVIFEGKPSAPLSISPNTPAESSAGAQHHVEDFEVDDSEQAGLLGRPTGRQFDRVVRNASRP